MVHAALARRVVEYSMRDVSGDVIPFRSRQRVPQHNPSAAWLEESWADKNLPWMRLAVAMLGKDDAEVEAVIGKLALAEVDGGSLICIVKRWRDVKRDLDQMRDALDVALNRSRVALERMGRKPDVRTWEAGFAAGLRGLSSRCPRDAHRLSWHVAYLAGAAERKRALEEEHQTSRIEKPPAD
jgi:hypothetical protein